MIRRILAAVDASERARDVLARAAEVARIAHATIRLYRTVAVPPDFPAAAVSPADALPAYLLEEAKARLVSLAAAHADVPCEIAVDESHWPAHAILRAADAYDADLIVIGSHGYLAVDRLLGTTAAKVVNTSTRDVLVVHERHAGSVDRMGQ